MQLPPRPARMPATLSAPTQPSGSNNNVPGAVLGGRYILGDLLGSGGMAEVRRGHDQVLDRAVAVKLFRGHSEPRLSGRERAEAQLLAGLDHPGLVKVHDVDHSETAGWVVMDLVEGSDLHRQLFNGALPLEQTWNAAHDVARTLAYVHAKGITHRDVKPSNILTREADPSSGRFGHVLTDFGIARRTDSDRITATGETIGTAAYFSPEQARGEAVTATTDIYALGLVLLECLTGEAAFEGRGLETALARLHRSPEIPDFVNAVWRDLLTRMTARDAADRPTAAEVVSFLVGHREALLGAGSPATMVLSPGSSSTPAPTSAGRDNRNFVLGLNDDDNDDGVPAQPARRPAAPKAVSAAPKAASADHPSGNRRRLLWAGAAVVLAVLVVTAIVVLSGMLAPAPSPEPLPSVPGTPGERLSELYESVQP